MKNNFYKNSTTEVNPIKASFNIDTTQSSFFIGSCFADNLYNVFDKLCLNSYNSPFGNIYNPKSIGKSIKRLIDCELITEDQCFEIDGLYQHFDFHSKLGSKSKDKYLEKINNLIKESHKTLLNTDLLIITLGTAYIFEKNDLVVNNCHKLPKNKFSRRVLNVSQIQESLIQPLKLLKSINKKMNIVLTLSPVRHLRDNPTENSYSKALLRVAIEEITKQTNSYYFPSYEILLDELRDYRWYDNSLTHPKDLAVEYIISKFLDIIQTEDLIKYRKKIEHLNSMLNHRIINSQSESSKKFILNKDLKLAELQREYKHLRKLQIIS